MEHAENHQLQGSRETPGTMSGTASPNVRANRRDVADHVESPRRDTDRAFGGHHLEDNLRHLGIKTAVTNEGPAFCPTPEHIASLPKEYETRVQIIQKYPEMRMVEETYYVKEVRNEARTVMVPRTRVITEEHERIDMVPIVKQVPKTRVEIVYRVVEEEREVTDMVPVVEMVPVPRIEKIPRLITEEFAETIEVPTVVEIPMTRTIQVPTGNYCEMEAGTYVNPTHFNLLGKGHGILRRTESGSSSSKSSSSSSSSSSDDEHEHHRGAHGNVRSPVTQTDSAPTKRKKKSLLKRIEEKIVG
ncbi:hypothetical protein R1flu_023906 [Riccia fluitans]|uniref:Uncharacterized protein n=1 Tax=Riccia fluitans TaxID=41844 RepID=A0ABD1XTC7_9MARC